MSTLEIAEISKTDTTVTLKANPSDTSNNNLYVWNTGDIAQEITTDADQKILCFPCENGSIKTTGGRGDYYKVYEEPYTPEELWDTSNTELPYRETNAINITTARIKINSEGWLIKTHPAVGNDYYEIFKLSTNNDNTSGASGGVYITYGWYYMTSWYYTKSETVFLPNFDINKYHNYTLIYHKVENSEDAHLWDIDFYVDDVRVISQRSENHIYITTFYWNYLPNCSYKFVRSTQILNISSIPEANEYTQLIANITASRNPVVTNVPSLSTSTLTCNVDGLLPRPKVDITNFFDQGVCTIEGLVIDPDSNLPKIRTNSYHGTTWSSTSGNYLSDSELEVIDNTIIRRSSNHTSSGFTLIGNFSYNTSSSGYITNIDCKVEELSEGINTIIGGDNAAYDNKYLYAGIAIKSIGNNKYNIYVYDKGTFYSEIYEYNPFEWHTYTICSNAYHGTLYLFIDNNFILSVKKFHNVDGRFNLFLGNKNQSTNSNPLFSNTVLFKNIKEYYFYNTYYEVMSSILYFNSKYIEHDWGELDFSVFPPKLIYADGTEWCDTDQINLNYSHSSNKVTIDNEDCLLVDGAIHVSSLKDNVAYQYPVVYCSNTQSVQIEFKFKVKQDAISSDRHNACLWSQGYYRGGGYNACGYMVELLSNGKWKVTTSNTDLEAKTNNPCSDELDLSFYEWHDIKIIMCQFPGYTTGGHDGYTELYIDGVYIPFRMPDNYTGTDTSRLSGTNVKATPSGSASAIIRNYWHYEFRSYRNWYYNEVIYYKNYKIKTLTLNPDYEEYPELTYLWNTGETTKQITVQPTVPTTYSCTVTQGTRTANASILIDTVLEQSKPIAVISPQEKPYIEHMIGRFYATNSYDINDPVSPIVKYIWNDVETVSPVFVTRVKRTDKIRLKVVNALGLVSDEVEVDLSKDTDQWGNRYKFLDIPMFLICSKGANLFDTLISRFPIPTNTLDLYSNFYPTEYDKYTSIGFTTDISTDIIKYMACLPHHGVAEYTANREQVDIYPLGISWLEKRNMIKYYNKVKGSKGSLMACLGHPEIQEEGYGSLEFVLDALGIITPKERYTIPRLLDLIELLLMNYDNGGLQKL